VAFLLQDHYSDCAVRNEPYAGAPWAEDLLSFSFTRQRYGRKMWKQGFGLSVLKEKAVSRTLLLSWLLGGALAFSAPAAVAQFGGMSQKTELVSRFDRNADGWLNAEERAAARAALQLGEYRRGLSWEQGGEEGVKVPSGIRLSPKQVRAYTQEPLFDPATLRTIFITFQERDWEHELADFYRTDVDVPATVVVDGKTYHDVGVHFRGNTSFKMISAGYKRSMDLGFDFLDKKQRLLGVRKLELMNSAADPTFLRQALYMHIMREYIPAPRVNYVRVVINGENWGVYVNQEHLTQEFAQAAGGDANGARWKVPGSPRARGGLAYLGDDPASYRRLYEIKSKDTPEAWDKLIRVCRVLNTTPPERLEKALDPLLDVDGVLRFLAVEKALINNDGYWVRASDYSLYIDAKGRLHVTPHDANETLRPTEGSMFGRFGGDGDEGAEPNSVTLGPFAGARDPNKALLYRLLAVPALRQRYMGYLREIADRWLDWNRLGPLAQKYQSVIAADVKMDTRKLFSTEAFTRAVTEDHAVSLEGGPVAPPDLGLKSFAEQRRAYLLAYTTRPPGTGP
jgi:spore coat protein CotH